MKVYITYRMKGWLNCFKTFWHCHCSKVCENCRLHEKHSDLNLILRKWGSNKKKAKTKLKASILHGATWQIVSNIKYSKYKHSNPNWKTQSKPRMKALGFIVIEFHLDFSSHTYFTGYLKGQTMMNIYNKETNGQYKAQCGFLIYTSGSKPVGQDHHKMNLRGCQLTKVQEITFVLQKLINSIRHVDYSPCFNDS